MVGQSRHKVVAMKPFILTLLAALNFFLLTWVSAVEASGRLSVFVSIPPQKFFVERIGGERVHVSVLVQPGASPATYEPKPSQMITLTKTQIFFGVGVPFERAWLKKLASANPEMRIVQTEQGIEKRVMQRFFGEEGKKGHGKVGREDSGGEHPHGIRDPHVWLSPPLVMLQARHILTGLLRVDPDRAPVYADNYKKFIVELVDLDAEIRQIFFGMGGGTAFVVFHPAWGYFADAYGLTQIPIEIEGKTPKAAQLQHVIRLAKETGVKVIFVQPQFSTKSAQVIAHAIGGEVVFADPLAGDWANSLRHQAMRFKANLR